MRNEYDFSKLKGRRNSRSKRLQPVSKVFKNIPQFKSEKEEKEFWLKHDSADYIDWQQVEIKLTKEERAIEQSLKEFVPVSRSHFKKLLKSIKQMKQIQKGKLKATRKTKYLARAN